jgi:hypothetical protein
MRPTLAFGFLPIPRMAQNDRRALTTRFCSVFGDCDALFAGIAFLWRTLAALLVLGSFFCFLLGTEPFFSQPSFFASASVKTFVLPSNLPNFFCQAY